MIVNKKNLPRDPEHFVDWELFWLEFPEEAGVICKEFINICRSSNKIDGKSTLMYVLNNTIPQSFPGLNNSFRQKFPDKKIDMVLGIGLWKIVDMVVSLWKYKEIGKNKLYENAEG